MSARATLVVRSPCPQPALALSQSSAEDLPILCRVEDDDFRPGGDPVSTRPQRRSCEPGANEKAINTMCSL